MCPASSITNPEPPAGPVSEVAATSTLTTPRLSRVYTSRTEEPFETGVGPEDLCAGATSLMVTLSGLSSRPYTPTKRNSAVTRPPMIAETSAVSAVLKMNYFLDPLPSRWRGPGAELYYIPAVYLPPAVLLHKVPGPLVVLDLPGKCGSGFAGDGRRVIRDLSVGPHYELHALHLVECTLEGGPVRKPLLPPTLGEKPGGSVVLPLRGCRIELLHRPLCRLSREAVVRLRGRSRRRLRGRRLLCTGRRSRTLLPTPALATTRAPAAPRVVLPGIVGPNVLVSTLSQEVRGGECSYHDEH